MRNMHGEGATVLIRELKNRGAGIRMCTQRITRRVMTTNFLGKQPRYRGGPARSVNFLMATSLLSLYSSSEFFSGGTGIKLAMFPFSGSRLLPRMAGSPVYQRNLIAPIPIILALGFDNHLSSWET